MSLAVWVRARGAAQVWHGVIELPYEDAFKKFSSEEETWSDLTILIFYNNLLVS